MQPGAWQTALILVVGLSLGTSASPAAAPSWYDPSSVPVGYSMSVPVSTGRPGSWDTGAWARQRGSQRIPVVEFRKLSGLTWEQMARLFGVSRRTLHLWASGRPMLPAHEEEVARVLATLKRIDRGSATANRSALVSITSGNEIAMDLLAEGRFMEFEQHLGVGRPRRVQTLRPLSQKERDARRPVHPSVAADALYGRVRRIPDQGAPDTDRSS